MGSPPVAEETPTGAPDPLGHPLNHRKWGQMELYVRRFSLWDPSDVETNSSALTLDASSRVASGVTGFWLRARGQVLVLEEGKSIRIKNTWYWCASGVGPGVRDVW